MALICVIVTIIKHLFVLDTIVDHSRFIHIFFYSFQSLY